jgi:toxin ParE1/3/4
MYTVKYMPAAIDDLRDIAVYIAQDNPRRALSFIDELERSTSDLLATAPLSGRIYKNETRYFPIGRYVMLYEVNKRKKLVEVFHIVAAATDWKK